MDCHDCITDSAERKKGEHLRTKDRGAIKALRNQGLGIRAIARQIGCAPSTVTNELKQSTPSRKSNKRKAPGYSRRLKADSRKPFIAKQVREYKWSLEVCCGYAKRQRLFSENEMVCTHALYSMAWVGLLPIQIAELPEALKHKPKNSKDKENKKRYGTSITDCPEVAALRTEKGRKRDGQEAVVLSLLELPCHPHPRQDHRGCVGCHVLPPG